MGRIARFIYNFILCGMGVAWGMIMMDKEIDHPNVVTDGTPWLLIIFTVWFLFPWEPPKGDKSE